MAKTTDAVAPGSVPDTFPRLLLQHAAVPGRGRTLPRGRRAGHDGLKQFAPPLQMSSFEFAVRRPAPKVGADSTAILREAGHGDAEIAGFAAARTI